MRARATALIVILVCLLAFGAPCAQAHDDGLHADKLRGGAVSLPPAMAARVQAAGRNTALLAGAATTGPQLGSHRVLVIPVRFSNTSEIGATVQALHDFVFGDVAKYFSDESYGRFTIAGDVVPQWVPLQIAHGCTDPYTTERAAEHAAQQAGFDPASYDHVVVWMSYDAACQWAGLAQMPGRVVWMNLPTASFPQLLVHEISHNLGSHHASTYNCPLPLSAACEQAANVNEYGDPIDPMGGGELQTSAYNKAKFGWLPAANQQTAARSGLYVLSPVETPSQGVQMLTVPRGDGSFFYLEFRQPLGSDARLGQADSRPDGVLIRVGQAIDVPEHTYLVNANQGQAGANGSALQVGETFIDWRTGIGVTGVSYTSAGFAVKITIPPAPFAPAPAVSPPSVFPPQRLSATRTADGVSLSWAAVPGADGYLIYRDKTPIAETTSAVTSFTDPADRRLHTYQLQALDTLWNATPVADVLAAQIPLLAPEKLQGHRQGHTGFLTWQRVADARAYRVYRDGLAVGEVPYPSFTDKHSRPGARYQVRALDQDGSAGQPSALTLR